MLQFRVEIYIRTVVSQTLTEAETSFQQVECYRTSLASQQWATWPLSTPRLKTHVISSCAGEKLSLLSVDNFAFIDVNQLYS